MYDAQYFILFKSILKVWYFWCLHGAFQIDEVVRRLFKMKSSIILSSNSPFHHNQETLLAIVGVFIDILYVDNVATATGSPVELYFSPEIISKRFLVIQSSSMFSDLLLTLSFNTFKAHFSPAWNWIFRNVFTGTHWMSVTWSKHSTTFPLIPSPRTLELIL